MKTSISIVAALLTLCAACGQTPLILNQPAKTGADSAGQFTNTPNKISVPPALAIGNAQTATPILVKLDETTLATLQPRPNAWWKDWLPLISTLIGAVTALFGGYLATTLSHKLQEARQKKQDRAFALGLEACIATELDFLGRFYANGIAVC